LTACPQGYTADSSRICIVCGANCASCNTTTCTQCLSGYFIVFATGQFVSSCISLNNITRTYYTNVIRCFACNLANCLVCVMNGYTLECQSCQSNTYRFNNTCVTTCPTGTYSSVNPNDCINCPANCTSCTSASYCSTCATGLALFNGICTSTCSNGFYLSNTNTTASCSACSAQCLSCNLATNCSLCVQPYILVNGACNGCVVGYFY